MPKTTKEKSIRNVELHPDNQKELDRVIKLAVKKGTGSKDEVMKLFYEAFESDDNQGISLRKMGIDNKTAQKYAVMFANSQLGRKSVQPVYDVFMNVSHVKHGEFLDEDKRKRPLIIASGGMILLNPKTNQETPEKLGEISAFAQDTEKIDILEEGNVYKLQAATSNTKPNFLHLKVDDRCGNAGIEKRKMTDIPTLQTKFYDLVPVKEKGENISAGKYDYKLFETRVESMNLTKSKEYYRLTLSDLSLTQDDYEKDKYDAYLTCLCNVEMMTGIGKGSVVRILGQLDFTPEDEEKGWSESITLSFPVMIYPMLLVEPQVYESTTQESDDDVEDASDYFKEDKEPETTDEEYFEDESKPEPEPESTDPYESLKDHSCVTGGDFGQPEDIQECQECEKNEPDVFKLCKQKESELNK